MTYHVTHNDLIVIHDNLLSITHHDLLPYVPHSDHYLVTHINLPYNTP